MTGPSRAMRRAQQRRRSRQVRPTPPHGDTPSDRRIALSARQVATAGADAVARLRRLYEGEPVHRSDLTSGHLRAAEALAARLRGHADKGRIGQCIHLVGQPAKYWTPSRQAVLCPACLATTPRPTSCDVCRRAPDTPLRRWFAASAGGLIVVAFTCDQCETDFAGASSRRDS